MTDLVELARRCEQGSGKDAMLGAEVEIAARGFPERAYRQANGMRPRGTPPLDRLEWAAGFFGAGPLASLDAAMTLVPEGWPSVYLARTDDGRWHAALAGNDGHMMAEDPEEYYVEADAATPAIALTAAALRARSSASEGAKND